MQVAQPLRGSKPEPGFSNPAPSWLSRCSCLDSPCLTFWGFFCLWKPFMGHSCTPCVPPPLLAPSAMRSPAPWQHLPCKVPGAVEKTNKPVENMKTNKGLMQIPCPACAPITRLVTAHIYGPPPGTCQICLRAQCDAWAWGRLQEAREQGWNMWGEVISAF